MHVRLRRYGLYGVLGLRDVGPIDVCGGDVSRVALAIGRRPGVGLLCLRCLQATGAEQIAIVLAGSRQLLLHVVQTGERQFRQLRRVRCAIRMRHESLHACVGRYYVHPIVFPVEHVHYLKRFANLLPDRQLRANVRTYAGKLHYSHERHEEVTTILAKILADLPSFHLKFVVHTGSEIMYNDHFTVGGQSVFLLDADSHEGLDAGASRYPTRGHRYPRAQPESCASCSNAVFLQIKVVRSGCLTKLTIIVQARVSRTRRDRKGEFLANNIHLLMTKRFSLIAELLPRVYDHFWNNVARDGGKIESRA